jgi:hypothetical protein
MPLESMSSISQRSTSIISQIPTMRFKVSEVRSLTLGGEFKTSRTTHASNIDHDSKKIKRVINSRRESGITKIRH